MLRPDPRFEFLVNVLWVHVAVEGTSHRFPQLNPPLTMPDRPICL